MHAVKHYIDGSRRKKWGEMLPKKFHFELKNKIAIWGLDTLEIEPFSLGGFNSRFHIFQK